jgi:hypothetical protein
MRDDVLLYRPFTEHFAVEVLAQVDDKRDAERLEKEHTVRLDTVNAAKGYNVFAGCPTQSRHWWAMIRYNKTQAGR